MALNSQAILKHLTSSPSALPPVPERSLPTYQTESKPVYFSIPGNFGMYIFSPRHTLGFYTVFLATSLTMSGIIVQDMGISLPQMVVLVFGTLAGFSSAIIGNNLLALTYRLLGREMSW
jgi:hypothetical protein